MYVNKVLEKKSIRENPSTGKQTVRHPSYCCTTRHVAWAQINYYRRAM